MLEIVHQPKLNDDVIPKNRKPLTERIGDIIQHKELRSQAIKRQMEEEKQKKEINECTFMPIINKPVSDKRDRSSNHRPVSRVDEMMRWEEDKNRRITETILKQDLEQRDRVSSKRKVSSVKEAKYKAD